MPYRPLTLGLRDATHVRIAGLQRLHQLIRFIFETKMVALVKLSGELLGAQSP
jgi:hypothetical protein